VSSLRTDSIDASRSTEPTPVETPADSSKSSEKTALQAPTAYLTRSPGEAPGASTGSAFPVGGVVGGIFGALAVAAVIIAVFILWKRGGFNSYDYEMSPKDGLDDEFVVETHLTQMDPDEFGSQQSFDIGSELAQGRMRHVYDDDSEPGFGP
jgi:hypothetical protein